LCSEYLAAIFIDKIQKFCLEKNIGIEIEVVDGEKS
jgi:hypothetical protein